MTIKEAIFEFEKRIPIQQAEDYDNVGLLCGDANREVSGFLVCHDALEIVVEEAIAKNLNFIITFHPIIFSGLKSITGKNYVERAVMKALENKIAIYAIHTAMDNHFSGVNYKICEQLGLQNQKILMPKKNKLSRLEIYVPAEYADQVKEALFAAGAGNIGFYDECSFTNSGRGTFRPLDGSNPFSGSKNVREEAAEELISVIFETYKKNQILYAMKHAHPYEEVAHQIISLENENHHSGLGRFGELEEAISEDDFLRLVQNKFGLKIIRHSDFQNNKIKRVGVLGGSGASGISAAKANNCDAYLTGDLKYHDFFQNEGQILICDIGHFESEQFVSQQLIELLSEIFPKFAVSKSVEKTNPVNYFL